MNEYLVEREGVLMRIQGIKEWIQHNRRRVQIATLAVAVLAPFLLWGAMATGQTWFVAVVILLLAASLAATAWNR
jgi:hypothetical protein